MIDTKFIYDTLGFPLSEEGESCHSFRPAKLAMKNCFAFLFAHNSDLSQEELADIAMERGAALLCSTEQIKDYPCLIVEDLNEAWIKLGAAYRNRYDVKVVGVTGSIGKTTTKEFIVAALATFGTAMRANKGNLNLMCWAGVTIQGLEDEHELYVQEVSESPVNNASAISKMIRPNISVMTKISEAHMEKLGTMENVIENCFGITESMADDGVVVINADDEHQIGYEINLNKVTYGIENLAAQYRAINIKPVYDVADFGIDFDVAYEDQIVPLRINFLGEHNVYCALAAFVTAKLLGLTDAEIQQNILEAKPKEIRQNLVNIGSYHLYFDCYNANVESTRSALKTLSLLRSEASTFKRIAVLGDISQSNPDALRLQQNIGKAVVDSKVDVLITCGELAKIIADVVKSESAIEVFSADNVIEAANMLQSILKPDDIVLFKSSNAANLELVSDQLFGTNFYETAQKIYDKQIVTLDDYTVSIYPKASYAKITEYHGKETIVSLPSIVDDQPVWRLGRNLFAHKKSIKRIELPDSIIRIEYQAFWNCAKLSSIKLPADLKSIGSYAFARCESLVSLSLPEGTVVIGYGAFIGCKKLRRVKLPTSLQILRDKAFQECLNLQEIVLPAHLKKIPAQAFANCAKLRELVIPHNIVEIAADAFEGCANFTIIGERGSYAEQYASLHKFRFLTYQQFKVIKIKRRIKRKLKAMIKRK